jgi:hypothetical protein
MNLHGMPDNPPIIKKSIGLFPVMALSLIISIFLLSNTYAKTEYKIKDLIFDNSAFLMVDGVKLHYRIWQTSSDIRLGNILLIHGLGGSTFSWRLAASELADSGYMQSHPKIFIRYLTDFLR